ncbi:MAG TPA: nucleoside deaminase [Bacteroidales bacterium]|nr:nucleoside deaminase [Bacteroidales bacterium]
MNDSGFMLEAIRLAGENIISGEGGPFGAIVVKDGKIVGIGRNKVTSSNDPTAHAEVVAIRDACRNLNTYSLEGCVIYSSCEPCPMCLSAIYWSRISGLFYAATRLDAADAGFDDAYLYEQISLDPESRSLPAKKLHREQALKVFNEWKISPSKIPY